MSLDDLTSLRSGHMVARCHFLMTRALTDCHLKISQEPLIWSYLGWWQDGLLEPKEVDVSQSGSKEPLHSST